jgi:hypothetical protein
MAEYNVRILDYKHGTQFRIYSKPIEYTSIHHPEKNHNTISEKPVLESDLSARAESENRTYISSINRTIQRIYQLSRANEWDYFFTLTYDPKMINSKDFDIVLSKLSYWLNNIKKRYAPDLKYLFVPEYHADKEKLHFHGLVSNIGDMPLQDSGYVTVGKYTYSKANKPYGTIIYNLPKWHFGFSTATKVRDSKKASSYITKYITKDLTKIAPSRHRFIASNNLSSADEKYLILGYEDLDRILLKYQKNFDYAKTIKCDANNTHITYIEVNKDEL